MRLAGWVVCLCALLLGARGIGRVLPGGSVLAFEREHDGIKDIALADVDHGLHVYLTRTPTIHEERPAWLPDGERISYIMQPVEGMRQLCVRRLPASVQMCQPPAALWDDWPVWSPDGEWLLIESIDERLGAEIYRRRWTEGSIERLTNTTGNDTHQRWSPDGTWIVFGSFRLGLRQLFAMRADGSSVRALGDGTANDDTPAWSPDGRWIAFVSDRDLLPDVYVLDALCVYAETSCQPRRLTRLGALVGDLGWSPDSRQIVLMSNVDGDFDIYTLDVVSADLALWTHNEAVDERPQWSPSGNALAYISNRSGRYAVYVQADPGAAAQRMTFGRRDAWSPVWQP